MQKPIAAILIASGLGVATAQAQEAASPLTANVSLTTNYKFRGQDQGNRAKAFKPALQGGFDYSSNGFYVGNWNSSIGWLEDANLESDVYAGYKGEFGGGIGYDIGGLAYFYPGEHHANTGEIYGGLTFGPASIKYFHTVSPRYFGFVDGRHTGYLDFAANYEIVKGVTLNGHIGYTRFSKDVRDDGVQSYVDYKAGATYDLGSGFAVGAAFIGAGKKDYWGDINKGRFIVTLTKSM